MNVGILCILANYWFMIGVESVPVLRREDLILTNVDERDVHLSPEDFQESRRLLEVDIGRVSGVTGDGDPLLRANKFEGDIAGLNSSTIGRYIEQSNSFARNAIRDSWRRWPNEEIPYVISSRYGTYSKRIIAKAMDEYHKKTCIRFVPREEEKHRDYIYIYPDDGCYSLVGRTGGRQPVSLDAGCMQTGTIQHELMHAAGFFHEQSRSDRDDWIDIVFTNVQPDATDQFEKYTLRTISLLDLPYDYSSIMHYGPYAFTKNSQRTIKAKKSGADRMGQRDGFSDLDLQKLNKLYQCSQKNEGDGGGSSGGSSSGSSGGNGAAITTTTTSRRPPVVETKCENKKWQCFFWYRLNYCSSYPDYMRQYCPKSCDMCGSESSDQERSSGGRGRGGAGGAAAARTTTTPASSAVAGSCSNTDSHCESWTRKGYCTKTGFSTYMRRTCPLACGICTRAAAEPPSMASLSDD